jgi:hypothetical protein
MCIYGIGLPFDHPIWRNLPPCTCGQSVQYPVVKDWRWWERPIVIDERRVTWSDTGNSTTITIRTS